MIFPEPPVQPPDGTLWHIVSRFYGIFHVLRANPGKDGGVLSSQ